MANFVSAFGLYDGVRLFASMQRNLAAPTGECLCEYKVPGYNNKIFLRNTKCDHSIFYQCMIAKQYDISAFPQATLFNQSYKGYLRNNKKVNIFDFGANIGLSAVWFAENFGDADIFAVEPDQKNIDVLRRNCDGYGHRVHVVPGGVWSEHERLAIVNPTSASAALRLQPSPESPHTEGVRAYTVQDIFDLAQCDEAFIVKIDIEGAQDNLFSKNFDWIEKTRLIILELEDWLFPWKGTSTNFFRAVSKYRFDYLIRNENIFCFRHEPAR